MAIAFALPQKLIVIRMPLDSVFIIVITLQLPFRHCVSFLYFEVTSLWLFVCASYWLDRIVTLPMTTNRVMRSTDAEAWWCRLISGEMLIMHACYNLRYQYDRHTSYVCMSCHLFVDVATKNTSLKYVDIVSTDNSLVWHVVYLLVSYYHGPHRVTVYSVMTDTSFMYLCCIDLHVLCVLCWK